MVQPSAAGFAHQVARLGATAKLTSRGLPGGGLGSGGPRGDGFRGRRGNAFPSPARLRPVVEFGHVSAARRPQPPAVPCLGARPSRM